MTQFEIKITDSFTIGHAISTIENIYENIVRVCNTDNFDANTTNKIHELSLISLVLKHALCKI